MNCQLNVSEEVINLYRINKIELSGSSVSAHAAAWQVLHVRCGVRDTSIAVVVTVPSTHCAHPRRDGQAELSWVTGYVARWFRERWAPSTWDGDVIDP